MPKLKDKLPNLLGMDAPFGFRPEDKFLNPIKHKESSGNLDVDHPIVTKGVGKGTKAIGLYGLLIPTVKNVSEALSKKGSVIRSNIDPTYQDPEIETLKNKTDEEIRQALEGNEDLQNRVARLLATHVLARQQGDEDKAAYSWIMGHNLEPERITPEKVEGSDYVQKVRKFREKLPEEVAEKPGELLEPIDEKTTRYDKLKRLMKL
jgi:hypothetical protein